MAVLVEAISVVIRADALLQRFPGGWDAFQRIVPNQTLCADNEIVRVGFMSPQDVESFVQKLQRAGLEFVRGGAAVDIAVVDQMRGPTAKCEWLEVGHVDLNGDGQRVVVGRLVGSQHAQVVTPLGWQYEGSLSSSFGFSPSGHDGKGMKFLRHEDGLDVYLDSLTGKEVYVGRTGES